MFWVCLHKPGADKTAFLVKGNSTVENRLAGNAVIPDAGRAARVIGRVQRMAAYAGDRDNVRVSLETGIHGPQNIVQIKTVHILIYNKNMF